MAQETEQFIIEQETKFYNPKEISSLWMLKQIIMILDKEIMSGFLPYELNRFKSETREKIRITIKFYLEKIKNGQLKIADYAQNIRKSMKFFAALATQKQEQEKNGKSSNRYERQIMVKFQQLKKELLMITDEKLTDSQKNASFQKIIKLAELNIEESIYDKTNLDKKPLKDKIKLFATRYKQYHNMVTYIAKNMKESRSQQLSTQFLPLLQRANNILKELTLGQEPSINTIFTQEMPVITREIFLGMKEEAFNEKLKKFIQLVTELIDKEKKFKQFSKQAKKTKERNWPIYSEFKIKQYTQLLNSLNTISQKMVPLPIIEVIQEKRNLILEDKDIDFQDIIVSFKKLTGCPQGKYKLNFSFELNKTIVNEGLDFCNEQTLEWNFTKKYSRGPDVKNLDNTIHNKTIMVNIFKKAFFGQDEYGRVSIPLAQLANNSKISSAIDIEHKSGKFQLHYEIKMRLCTQLFTPITVPTILIVNQFEPLNINDGLEQFYIDKIPAQYREEVPAQKPQQQPLVQNTAFSITPQLQFLKRDDESKSYAIFSKLEDNQIPQGLTREEVLNPEEFSISFCSSYLEQMDQYVRQAPTYYSKIGKIQDRKNAIQLSEQCIGRKYFMDSIGDKIEDGLVTLGQIYTYYCNAIVKDRLRIEFYIKLGLYDWASFCLARRQLLIKEMIENEWDIEDPKDIDVNAIFQKISDTQTNKQKYDKIMSMIVQDITFLKRGGEFREATILKDLKEEILPKGLTLQQALNPEDLDWNYSMTYLQLIAQQEAKAQTFFSKQGMLEEKQRAKTLQENAVRLQYNLNNQLQSGNLDGDEVLDFYQKGIVLDRLRIQVYMKIKLYEWVGFCLKKRNIYIEEMKENEFPIQDQVNIDIMSYI